MMKKIVKGIFAITSLFFISSASLAQSGKERQGDSRFELYEYVNAIEIYEKIAEKGFKSVNTLSKLGDAYYFNAKFADANKWYAELFDYAQQSGDKLASEYYYRYSQTLKSMQDYQLADHYMDLFSKMEEEDHRARLFQDNKTTYLKDITDRVQRYELQPLSINSEYSDYGSSILGDNLIFTSARETENTRNAKLHKWTNEAYTSLYSSTILSDGTFSEPVILPIESVSKVNQASAVFTKDGQTMYFTRNNVVNGKKRHNQDYSILLKLYKATKNQNDDSWGNVEELPFNSDNFNTAHPALSPDQKWLYFSSDRQGTIGNSDIFRVAIYEDGTYSEPENLGARINTEGRETFPFVSNDGYLYFSSDGRPGLGGLDVFMAKLNFDGSLGAVVNVGAPLNSPEDDFAFYIDQKNRKGFISSNREPGVGGDDIYFFQVVDCKQVIKGYVFDKSTNQPIANAVVTLYDNSYNVLQTLSTDQQGNYQTMALDCDQKFRLKVEAPDYHTSEESIVLGRVFNDIQELNIGLDPVLEIIEKEDDLFKKLNLDPIYFDFDKSNIRSDAAVELAKVVEVLNMYPQIKIDVRSHTDSRGSDAYNLKLSDRRAKATMKWIIDNGIDASRVSGKGYGETELVNDCKNNVPCSIQQHQQNRRSEFIILEI
ncbi:OmpA family protein [Myroides sp. LJL119]